MKLKDLINKLHKYERASVFVNDLFSAIFNKLSELDKFVEDLKKEFFFDTLIISASAYEKLMNLTSFVGATLDDRRSAIWARWRSNGKNTVKLIQDICNAWKNGEVEVDFVNGKIQIQFVRSFGIPSNLDSLKESVEEIKPAHLDFLILFKYLLIENTHEVKTIEEMQQITIDSFSSGHEE